MTSFQQLHQPTGRTITVDNHAYLFFGGTAYLGLLDNPAYIDLYQQGIGRYGLNNGTSRANNVQLGVYDEVEERLAARFGFQSAAVFSCGYLAAQAAVRALAPGRKVLYAPGTHPALWLDHDPGVRVGFEAWLAQTVDYINQSSDSRFMLIANAIDNLSPAYYDFTGLSRISKDKDVLLVLDDSHGLAVVNIDGVSTSLERLQRQANLSMVVVASLAKGLGTDAGVVLASRDCMAQIKAHPIFMGASPPAPAAMYALRHGETIYRESFNCLHQNILYFTSQLTNNIDFRYIENFPVFSADDPSLFSYLLQRNILISSFPYPLPSSPLLNRVVITALHHTADLDRLLEVCFLKSK